MAETTPKPKRKYPARKTSCPPHRGKNAKHKYPGHSQRLRELWQDPEWRAALLVKRKKAIDARVAAGTWNNRLGIPDGMRKAEAIKVRAQVQETVKATMSELDKAGLLDESPEEAKQALAAAMEVMRMPGDQKLKLAAARLVLDFTKSKPASKAIVAVDEAEQWLKQIADKDHDDDSGEAA